MKKILGLVVLSMIFVVSCQKDAQITRDDYLGNWHCKETGSSFGAQNYDCRITSESSSSSKILISNFFYQGPNFYASADVSDKAISIRSQNVNGYIVSGSGSISNDLNTITLSFTANDGSGLENVTVVLTRF